MSTIYTVEDQTATTTLDDTDIFLVPDTNGTAFKATVQTVRQELANQLVSQTTATLSVTSATHAGKTILLDKADGITVTLPAAAGTGDIFRFVVKTTATSDIVIQVADATDVIQGTLALSTDIAGVSISAGSSDDTITMNGTTSGGILGSFLELQDVATNLWMVTGTLVSSGVESDPFSAAVS